jgi:hypothetical protein
MLSKEWKVVLLKFQKFNATVFRIKSPGPAVRGFKMKAILGWWLLRGSEIS